MSRSAPRIVPPVTPKDSRCAADAGRQARRPRNFEAEIRVIARLAKRLLTETDARLLAKFAYNFGWKGMRATARFRRRSDGNGLFPPFLFISITNNCQLRCRGCWVSVTDPPRELAPETLDNIIREAKSRGSYFFGVLGGEPLLYEGLFDVIGRHPDCYFQVFTNGLALGDSVARQMRRLGNVTPLISIEGREDTSDQRRGGVNVYRRALEAIENCRTNRLITGVATSVCRSNIDEVVSREFVDELCQRGVHYIWYYIYRPAGALPSPELALSTEDILRLRRFTVDIRSKAPLLVVDAYWDHQGRAFCPAAVGISHHINPAGDVEPCPPIQFARENIGDGSGLAETLENSRFLKHFRKLAGDTTQGCILLEHPGLLRDFMVRENARDTSGRGTALRELRAMEPRPGHDIPGEEIPEKLFLYRFAKKHWFFGFGAYG